MKLSTTKPILRYKDGKISAAEDPVIIEYSLSILINGVHHANLLCSPQELNELVIGNLYGKGLIDSVDEILTLQILQAEGIAQVRIKQAPQPQDALHLRSTGPLSNNDICFDKNALLRNLEQFYADSALHRMTAAVHRATLCNDGGILLTAIDISRHNALDKVIGMALQQNTDLTSCYLITSGRVPSDMIIKAINAQLPMLAARAAPTDRAIQLAQEANLTLLGFSRENRFNIYNGSHRINL